jgi:hypothetical protein
VADPRDCAKAGAVSAEVFSATREAPWRILAPMPGSDRLPPPPFWRTRYFALTVYGTHIRVVTLSDGETVHNVLKDSDFVE